MKKIIGCLIIAVLFLGTSCKKVTINNAAPTNYVENGREWPGWEIKHPIEVFDTSGNKICFDIYNNRPSDAAIKLVGKRLLNDGPKKVYAVQPYFSGNFYTVKNDLERRGWKLAPLSYLLALSQEYTHGDFMGYFWNLYCLDNPAEINFGNGDQRVAISLSGNTYDPVTNTRYATSLGVIPFSEWYGSFSVLVYRDKE